MSFNRTEYRRANRHRLNAQNRAYRKANKARFQQSYRKHDLMRHFGLTLADYNEMLLAQECICKICGHHPDAERLAVDHTHIPGYDQLPPEEKKTHVRGLLCAECNLLLGKAHDSPSTLRLAATYLEQHI